ncbi:MAG TPA: ElyC/SanA/YdcF family protein [Bacteroidia bacterium]|nr:ElyC/SanA/YdcF family protein [Bacteroidia bacterium]
MKKYRKPLIVTLTLLILFLIATIYANSTIAERSKPFITDDINKLNPTKVGLLLGTSKKMRNGSDNDFFFNRIEAAVELYKSGKIKYIIVSGDNSKRDYNEPLDMKTELIKKGVPDSLIYLDYAGFRTLDSVVRAKEIFGQSTYIIISQKFHNERAVYIARRNGIEAFGYNAKEVVAYKGLKTKIREYFARDKVFLDFLFNVEPKFMGEHIKID